MRTHPSRKWPFLLTKAAGIAVAFPATMTTESISREARWERILAKIVERASEVMREGGMLVVVFGLLDFYLGEGHPAATWPWYCEAIGGTMISLGIAAEVLAQEVWR